MPSYRVRPGTIPKHLKIPAQPSPTSVALPLSSVKPPIRKASTPTSASIPQNPSILSANHIGQFPKAANPGTFQIPRFGASKEGWSAGKSEYRNVANVHPFAKLKDPLSVRAYDWIVRLSVPSESTSYSFILEMLEANLQSQHYCFISYSGRRQEKSRILLLYVL